jgi:hypothetical protein
MKAGRKRFSLDTGSKRRACPVSVLPTRRAGSSRPRRFLNTLRQIGRGSGGDGAGVGTGGEGTGPGSGDGSGVGAGGEGTGPGSGDGSGVGTGGEGSGARPVRGRGASRRIVATVLTRRGKTSTRARRAGRWPGPLRLRWSSDPAKPGARTRGQPSADAVRLGLTAQR